MDIKQIISETVAEVPKHTPIAPDSKYTTTFQRTAKGASMTVHHEGKPIGRINAVHHGIRGTSYSAKNYNGKFRSTYEWGSALDHVVGPHAAAIEAGERKERAAKDADIRAKSK